MVGGLRWGEDPGPIVAVNISLTIVNDLLIGGNRGLMDLMTSFPQMILFSLALFGDLVRALPANKRQSWNFWMGSPEGVRSFNKRSFAVSVSRLLQTEKIEKAIKNGRVEIKITPHGLRFLSQSLHLEKFSRRKWDEKWRVVIFDINEKDRKSRDFLRRELKDLGFGMLQESVWISPFPIEDELSDLLDTWEIKGEILVSRSEILIGNQKDIAGRVWDLGKINDEYLDLNEEWESLPESGRTKGAAFKFQQRYFDLLKRDPFLPVELLPKVWFAKETKKIYTKKVNQILLG